MIFGALNITVQVLALIDIVIGDSIAAIPTVASWALFSLMALPLGLLAFRWWAVLRGWSMVYAHDAIWLDTLVGKAVVASILPLSRMPLPVQHRLASAIMSNGWLTWADVRECASAAGLPQPDIFTLATLHGTRPATRSDIKRVVSGEAWHHACMMRYTGSPAQPRPVPVARF